MLYRKFGFVINLFAMQKKNHSRLFVSYTYLYICVMREEGCRIIVGLHSELNETILKLSRKANITKKNNKIYIKKNIPKQNKM